MSGDMLHAMERHNDDKGISIVGRNDVGNISGFPFEPEHNTVEKKSSKFEFLQITATATLILLLAVTTIWGKIILMKMGVFTSDLQGVIKLLVLL